MRIAVALFGVPRGYRVALPSIAALLKNLRASANVDVFIEAHRPRRIVNPRSGEDYELPDEVYRTLSGMGDLITIDEPSPESWGSLLERAQDPYADGQRTVRNLLWALLGLSRATERALATAPDVVVFLRLDLAYEPPLPPVAVRTAARSGRLCLLPDWQWWGGYNDRLAICSADAAGTYGSRLHRVSDYLSETRQPLHAEALLYYALYKDRVRVRAIDVRASRVRDADRVVAENFDSRATRRSRLVSWPSPKRHALSYWLARRHLWFG